MILHNIAVSPTVEDGQFLGVQADERVVDPQGAHRSHQVLDGPHEDTFIRAQGRAERLEKPPDEKPAAVSWRIFSVAPTEVTLYEYQQIVHTYSRSQIRTKGTRMGMCSRKCGTGSSANQRLHRHPKRRGSRYRESRGKRIRHRAGWEITVSSGQI